MLIKNLLIPLFLNGLIFVACSANPENSDLNQWSSAPNISLLDTDNNFRSEFIDGSAEFTMPLVVRNANANSKLENLSFDVLINNPGECPLYFLGSSRFFLNEVSTSSTINIDPRKSIPIKLVFNLAGTSSGGGASILCRFSFNFYYTMTEADTLSYGHTEILSVNYALQKLPSISFPSAPTNIEVIGSTIYTDAQTMIVKWGNIKDAASYELNFYENGQLLLSASSDTNLYNKTNFFNNRTRNISVTVRSVGRHPQGKEFANRSAWSQAKMFTVNKYTPPPPEVPHCRCINTNICNNPPGACKETMPYGMCDPNGDGGFEDGNWNRGWCGGP